MNLLILAAIFAVLWFSADTIRLIFNSVYQYAGNTIGNKAFMWFSSLLLINLAILLFIIGFYYYKISASPGAVGPRGYPGSTGLPAPPCYDTLSCPA
jgi:hypothetical protein